MRPQSTQYGLPLILEDSTGSLGGYTCFSDLYDRLQASIASSPKGALAIRVNGGSECVVEGLGSKVPTVTYFGGSAIPVKAYLREISARSPARRFTASDSQSYTWSLTQSAWACTDSQGSVVAEYTLNDKSVTGSACAAVLTVEEAWSSIILELLTTLTLVRCIAAKQL